MDTQFLPHNRKNNNRHQQSMNKRAFKLLMLDFERLDDNAIKYVHSRLNCYILSRCTDCDVPRIIFCLESTPRTDPIVAHIRRWIDEAVPGGGGVAPSRTASYIAKVCVVCGVGGASLKSCARCRSLYYCSKECQTADWPVHRSGCQKVRNRVSVICNTFPSG